VVVEGVVVTHLEVLAVSIAEEHDLADVLARELLVDMERLELSSERANGGITGLGGNDLAFLAGSPCVDKANAVSESGDLVFADLTGTRVPGVLSGKNVILVVGSNKIVKSYADAVTRLENYVLPLESARVRVVFKVPASAANNIVGIKGSNPFGAPGRIHVIIVKGKYGF